MSTNNDQKKAKSRKKLMDEKTNDAAPPIISPPPPPGTMAWSLADVYGFEAEHDNQDQIQGCEDTKVASLDSGGSTFNPASPSLGFENSQTPLTPSTQLQSAYVNLSLTSTSGNEKRNDETSIFETPKRRKLGEVEYSEVIVEQAIALPSGCVNIKAKVIERTVVASESIMRVADSSGYIDILFDATTKTEFTRIKDATYLFNDVIKDIATGKLKYWKGSSMRKLHVNVDVISDIPKIEGRNLSTSQIQTSTIVELFIKAEKAKFENTTDNKYTCKGHIAGIVTQKYNIPRITPTSPSLALTVIDRNLDSVKIKLFKDQAEKFDNILVLNASFLFTDLSVRLEEGRNERCFLSSYSSKIVPTKVEYTINDTIGKLFVVGVKVGSLKAYMICPSEICKWNRWAVNKSTSICTNPKCNKIVSRRDALAGYLLAIYISSSKHEAGKLYTIFDESVRNLIQIDDNQKFENVGENDQAQLESRLEDGIWEISGDANRKDDSDFFNIRFSQKYIP